jgi:hypothetical protein
VKCAAISRAAVAEQFTEVMHGDMVARAHPAGCPPKALERWPAPVSRTGTAPASRWSRIHSLPPLQRRKDCASARGLPGSISSRGVANELAVLDHRLPGRNRELRASLWPRGNTLAQRDTQHGIAGLQGAHGGGNIVGIIKPDGIGGGHV